MTFSLAKLCANHLVVHSRDDKGVGMAHEIKPPKNQPQFSQMTMEQYWLDKIEPKLRSFLIDPKFF